MKQINDFLKTRHGLNFLIQTGREYGACEGTDEIYDLPVILTIEIASRELVEDQIETFLEYGF